MSASRYILASKLDFRSLRSAREPGVPVARGESIPKGASSLRIDVTPVPGAPELPPDRRAAIRHHIPLPSPAPSSSDRRPDCQGGALLRPSVLARRRLVSLLLPRGGCPGAGSTPRKRPPRRRSNALLPLPSRRAGAGSGDDPRRAADHDPSQPGRQGVLALPKDGAEEDRATFVRERSRRRGVASGRRGGATPGRPALQELSPSPPRLCLTRTLCRPNCTLACAFSSEAPARAEGGGLFHEACRRLQADVVIS